MPVRRIAALLMMLVGVAAIAVAVWPRQTWSPQELATLRSLWIGSLGPVPADPSNSVADNPAAAALGKALFFDARFSANGQVSCSTCHQAERGFTDGRALAQGVGTTDRTAMPLPGTQYADFLFWDGRKDSQWAQALGPLESPVEHGGTREQYAQQIKEFYATEYETVFGPLPELSDGDRAAATRVFVNMGKAIAAYERTLVPGASRFDAYVADVLATGSSQALTGDEVAGLKLFIGEARCTTCHMSPLFTNGDFHNTGVPARAGLPEDTGRAAGAAKVLTDEFNCLSQWSDARAVQCTALRFLKAGTHEQERQFKVPSLRDVAARGPYMHAGQYETLSDVLRHYNTAPEAPAGHSEITPLRMTDAELRQLEAFLRTL
jgi:cytochrome c peroxidase